MLKNSVINWKPAPLRELQYAASQFRVAKRSLGCFIFVFATLFMTSCNTNDAPPTNLTPESETKIANTARQNTADEKRAGTRRRIVAFGDSLTAGYGLPAGQSYPSLLQKKLDADGYDYEVVNAGVSGDTTSGGLRRIAWTLDGAGGKVDIVILELGANDILRGQPVEQMRRNLATMIEEAQRRGAQVLLAGMLSPPNWGADYSRQVQEAYRSLAAEYKVPLIPFFLDRVAGRRELNLQDGAHPNAEGTRIVADTVYEALKPMIRK
jgi:acyl-CoA thioesterase-1